MSGEKKNGNKCKNGRQYFFPRKSYLEMVATWEDVHTQHNKALVNILEVQPALPQAIKEPAGISRKY